MSDEIHTPLWRTKGGVVLCGFLIVAGFYLLTEHTAHALGALPFLLLAACPLMHIFMHHGHHGHGGAPNTPSAPAQTGRNDGRTP